MRWQRIVYARKIEGAITQSLCSVPSSTLFLKCANDYGVWPKKGRGRFGGTRKPVWVSLVTVCQPLAEFSGGLPPLAPGAPVPTVVCVTHPMSLWV